MPRVIAILLAACAVVAPRAAALPQALPAGMRLAAIEVTGAERLTRADIVGASGLKIGSTVTVADLDASVQRLGKTGLFAEVSYRYRFKGTDLIVTLDVKEAKAETRVVFDNFPWFSDEEITTQVAKAVPGFTTHLSDNAEGIDRIVAALSQMLRARNLPGKVEYIPYLDTRNGTHAHLFKVTGVAEPICDIAFSGVDPSLLAMVRDATAPLLRRDYSRIGSTDFLRGTLVPFYRRLGHLRVRLPGISAHMGAAGTRCAGNVVVGVPIEEGAVYWWKGAVWSGAVAFSARELDAALGMKVGDVADGTKIDRGIQAVTAACGRKGYLVARVTPAPQFDDIGHSVAYAVQVLEGPQFLMGDLTITGAPEPAVTMLSARWKLKRGDVYDAGYLSEFMTDVRKSDPQLMARLGVLRASLKPDTPRRIVDVVLAFGPAPK